MSDQQQYMGQCLGAISLAVKQIDHQKTLNELLRVGQDRAPTPATNFALPTAAPYADSVSHTGYLIDELVRIVVKRASTIDRISQSTDRAHEAIQQFAARCPYVEEYEVTDAQLEGITAPLEEHLNGIKDALSVRFGWHNLSRQGEHFQTARRRGRGSA